MEKFIQGFNNQYIIYDSGEVYSLKSNKFLKQILSPQGYLYVNLSNNGSFKHMFIHQLVAKYFLESIQGKIVVHHIDGNKQNNNIDNLQYVTNKENIQKASEDNLLAFGERNGQAKLSSIEVEEIKNSILSSRQLGKMYGVSHVTILNIKNNKYRVKG